MTTPAADSLGPPPRGIGWGGWLACGGLALFGIGLAMIGMAFDAMSPDTPGQWTPFIVALLVIGLVILGLALRWRVAYVVALIAGVYQVVTFGIRLANGNLTSVPLFEAISIIPGLMVVGGLAASWRNYWRAGG